MAFARDSIVASLLCHQAAISVCYYYSSNLDAMASWHPWCSLKVGHCEASCRAGLPDYTIAKYCIFTSPENSLAGVHFRNFYYFFLTLTSADDFAHGFETGSRGGCCAGPSYPSAPFIEPASHSYVYYARA